MKTPPVPPQRNRGVGGVEKPAAGNLKVSGIGDLKSPRIDGGGPTTRPVPAADEPVIKGMQAAAQDGVNAGAQDETVRHPPGSQPHNIPGRDAIVPPPEWHTP